MSSPQDVEDVDRALLELTQLSSNRLIARLRPLLPTIDAQIGAGVPRKEIVEALQANGFDVSMKSLDNALYRWRRRALASAGGRQDSTAQAEPPRLTSGTQIPLLPDADTKAGPAEPSITRGPTVTNRGDVARLRRAQTTDLNYLAQVGKKSSRRNQ